MNTAASLTHPAVGPARRPGARHRRRLPARRWLFVLLLVLAASALVVVLTGIRPSYDGFGFLVWGRQVLHWNLNTDGAPSWKPLPFLFTLPYAVTGHVQMWLWMTTAVAGALGSAVLAARLAYRITGRTPGRRFAPYLAGAFAAVAVLGIGTYSHLVLIANSDPLIVALCLGAIDCHLSRRPKLAFVMLVLASLGRPEAWAFAGLYAVWSWRAVPSMWVLTMLGLALIPAFWFAIPALTSHSWFIAGDLALNQATVIHGSKILGVVSRLRSLYELPMQLAFLGGVVLAAVRRDRVTLGIAAAALLWVVIEIGFAYHGWSAVSRYMIEPASVMVVVAAGAVGRLLADTPRLVVLRLLGPAAVVALLVTLAPAARTRVRTTHHEILKDRAAARRVDRLEDVIERDGGLRKIRSCGQPVSQIGLQSTLAWELHMNVGNVGYNPGHAIKRGRPMVVFQPHKLGWRVRAYNLRRRDAARCEQLRADTDFN
ncbi:MAG TPA: hypothetical protein VG365_07610 [Solirubrobacteraceae bacterium]|nr:hypothetical protein [Solirubrobacteraceae bacterium]